MKTDIKNIKDRENYMTWLMEEIKTVEDLIKNSKNLTKFEKNNILSFYDALKYYIKEIIIHLINENSKLKK